MMAFSKDLVVSVIVNNKHQREYSDQGKRHVHVPFGSEYKIRIKNKISSPVLADVSIDGTDVLNGGHLLLMAGESTDIERFVENLDWGRKFKFISVEEGKRTGQIDDPYREENGLIHVTFYHAIVKEQPCTITRSTKSYGMINCTDSTAVNPISAFNCLDIGATVEGGYSQQSFEVNNNYKKGFQITTIIIRLVGQNLVKDTFQWGVFIDQSPEPIAKFKDSILAYTLVGASNFSGKEVSVRRI